MANPRPELRGDAIEPGTRVGRYLVVEVVGAGGIGIVYAAYDADLDRKVALKLLQRSELGGGGEAVGVRQARLRREALALARLSHPNVVPVYEVGSHAGQIFISMEFIAGLTLDEWLERGPRTWAEIVAVFVQAGRGLAAAHAADIVHRDFKPDNVRVGDDGRVRVLDFGLAGSLRERERERDPEPEPEPPTGFDPLMTREGQVMGTPAYMAPEQAMARTVDARSDQFSFCVALYEALYGVRPFAGRFDDPGRFQDLGRARALPGVRPPGLPTTIERALVRGLALAPDQRFADLDALLSELGSALQPRRRRAWLPVAALGVALALAPLLRGLTTEPPARACAAEADRLDEVWNPAVAGALREATLAADRPYAANTWTTLERALASWAARWRRARRHACEAALVHGHRSPVALERRLACLDRQLVQVDSTLAALRRLERDPALLLDRLTPLLAKIPDPDACTATLLGPAASGDDLRRADPRAAAVRTELAAIDGLLAAGEVGPAGARAEAALDQAERLADEQLRAEALLRVGLSIHALGHDPERAAATLELAARAATRADHPRVLVRAAAALVGNLAATQAKLELARLWAGLAEAAFARLGDDTDVEIELRTELGRLAAIEGDYTTALAERRRARALARARGEADPAQLRTVLAIGDALRELGRFDEAAALLDEARRVAVAELGATHPVVPELLDALGNVEAARGRYGAALDHHRESLTILAAIHGPNHRSVAKTLNNMAIIFDQTGRYHDAVTSLTQARSILVERVGPAHPDVAFVDVNLGSALQNLDRHDQAIRRYVAALAVLEASLGEDHVAVGITRQNLGSARAGLGDHADALAELDRSLAILRAAFGDRHPSVASVELNRGRSLAALDQPEQARAAYQRALAAREAIYGRQHPELVEVLAELAALELGEGQPARALGLAERAESLADASNTAVERATAKLILAKVLLADPELDPARRTRAHELGRAALGLVEGAEAGAAERAEILAWLRAAEIDLGAPTTVHAAQRGRGRTRIQR